MLYHSKETTNQREAYCLPILLAPFHPCHKHLGVPFLKHILAHHLRRSFDCIRLFLIYCQVYNQAMYIVLSRQAPTEDDAKQRNQVPGKLQDVLYLLRSLWRSRSPPLLQALSRSLRPSLPAAVFRARNRSDGCSLDTSSLLDLVESK